MVKKKRLKISDDLEEKNDCIDSFSQEEHNSLLSDLEKACSDSHLSQPNISQMTPSIRTSSRVTAIKALQKLSSSKESKTPGQKPSDKNSEQVSEENKFASETSHNIEKTQKNRISKKNTKSLIPDHSEKKTTKRTCEFWTSDDKLNFFDALGEHGKDFDSIQSYLALKAKRKSLSSSLAKNREQVRHFYYRTWNKISKYLEPDDSINKQILELYGLINYGELRRRTGGFLLEKNLQKLNELVTLGSTIIKHKGKKIKIRTPICPTLKKINNIEGSEQEEIKLPKDIYVEFRPASNKAWLHVQNLSLNPRIRSKVPIQRRLRSLIEYLQKRWKSFSQSKKKGTSRTENTGPLDGSIGSILRILPPKNCNIKLVKFDPFGHSLYTNISLEDYKKRCGIESKPKGFQAKTKSASPKNLQKTMLEEKKDSGLEEVSSKINDKEVALDQDPSTVNDPIPHIDEVNKSLSLLNSMSESNPVNNECNLEKMAKETETIPKSSISKSISPSPRPFSFEDIYLSNQKEMSNLTLGEILSMAEQDHHASSPSQFCDKVESTSEKEQVEKILPNEASLQDACCSQELRKDVRETEAQIKEKIDNIKKGWTLKNAGLITVGELFLMLGCSEKLELEYDWEVINNETLEVNSLPNDIQNENTLSLEKDQFKSLQEKGGDKNYVQSALIVSSQKKENPVGNIMTALVRFSNTLLNEQKEKIANTSSNASIQVKMNSPSTRNINVRNSSRITSEGSNSNLKPSTCNKASLDSNRKVSSTEDQNSDTLEKKHKFVKPKKPPSLNSVSYATEFRKQIFQLSRRPRGRNKKLVIQRPLVPINKIGYMPEPVKVIECSPKRENSDAIHPTQLEMPVIELAQSANQILKTYPHCSSQPVLSVSLSSVVSPSNISPPVISIPETSLPVSSTPIVLFISTSTTDLNASKVSQIPPQPLQTHEEFKLPNSSSNLNSFKSDISTPQKENESCRLENVFRNISSNEAEQTPISESSLNTHRSLNTPVWTNEMNDYSIGSFLDSPIKEGLPLTMGTEVNHVVSSLLSESSSDFVNKFSELAHHVEESSSNS